MNRFFVVGFFVLTLLAFAGTSFIPTKETVNTIFDTPLKGLSIGDTVIDVAIADSQQTRRVGLSNLSALPSDSGLFFVFLENDTHGIWMKDMEFPIDIIWLDEELKVVDMRQDISPDTYPTSFHSRVPSRFVLEVGADFSTKHDVKIGSKLFWVTL